MLLPLSLVKATVAFVIGLPKLSFTVALVKAAVGFGIGLAKVSFTVAVAREEPEVPLAAMWVGFRETVTLEGAPAVSVSGLVSLFDAARSLALMCSVSAVVEALIVEV